MNTRKFFLSLLLLVTATFMSGVLAQSAEDAAKYGQLQEIQVPKAGKLGKYIKKKDSNVTAVKISGELNAKDWDVLFSLPNVAYLDLQNVTNVAPLYKFRDNQGYNVEVELSDGQILLNLPETLKFLAVPMGAKYVLLPDNINYTFEMLVLGSGTVLLGYEGWYGKLRLNDEYFKGIKFNNINVTATGSILDGNGIVGYLNSKFSGGDNNYTNCKTLYIQGDGQYCNCDNIYPEEIVILSTGDKILRKYTGSAKIVDLSGYSYIYAYAFNGSTVEIVNTGDKITIIPEYCFLGCKNLKKITMPNVTTVKQGAFSSTNIISSLHLTYKLPAESAELNLTELKGTGITKVDLTEHPYAPELKRPTEIANSNSGSRQEDRYAWEDMKKNIEFVIPGGARNHRYNVGDWKELKVTEFGVQDAYTFKLDTIGSLKNFINDDNALNIRKLTLKGVMDETEFEHIRKCKYLTYLDLSQCFTFASVEVAKNKAKAELAFAQLVALASGWDRQQKELQHANHEISTEQLQQAQIRDYFIQNSGIEDISMEDVDAVFGQGKVILSSECYFPNYALQGLFYLEEIKFPKKLLKIEKKNLWAKSEYYSKLRKVTFSKELKYLGESTFDKQKNLTEVNFPDSLQYIGQLCFNECNLKKIDLSKTQIKQCDDHLYKNDTNLLVLNAFYKNPIEEFHSPKNLVYRQKWYDEAWLKNDKPNEVVMYMNTSEPFCNAEVLQGLYGRIKELHIPRGMKAAWRGYPNVIDDIDL